MVDCCLQGSHTVYKATWVGAWVGGVKDQALGPDNVSSVETYALCLGLCGGCQRKKTGIAAL